MALAKNIKVLQAEETKFGFKAVVRFDFDEVGYVAETYDKVQYESDLTLYTEDGRKFVYGESWRIGKGTLHDGVISQSLYKAMDEAFDVAYEQGGY